jgi:glycosyltransferase involved in cell wall biosynthesis
MEFDSKVSIVLCTDYFPPKDGGVETVVQKLATSLSEKGAEVTVLALSGSTDTNTEASFNVAYVSSIELTGYIGLQSKLSMRYPFEFYKLVNDIDPDVIHLHNRFFFTSIASVLASAFSPSIRDIPLVTTFHLGDIGHLDGLGGVVASVYDKMATKALTTKSESVITVSDSIVDEVLPNSTKSVVVPNGVDASEFTPGSFSVDNPTVLFVGRLVENKGPLEFVRAAEKLRNAHPEVTFKMIGTGPLQAKIEESLLDHGNSDLLETVEYVESMPETMADADIFCRPSYSEGLPLTLLEAMASGLPVVVSDVAGVGDILDDGDTGLLVKPGNVDTLVSNLDYLLENPDEAIAMGERARETVLDGYTWDSRSESVVEIYSEILKSD